jgi:hypothetical protein
MKKVHPGLATEGKREKKVNINYLCGPNPGMLAQYYKSLKFKKTAG